MLRAHKIALDPNNTQATFFSQCCGVARFTYNWALAEWKRQYYAGATPHEAALRKQLNQGKAKEFPWMLAVPKAAPQQAIKDLGNAFQRFFSGQNGYPTFKKKYRHDSCRVDNGPRSKGADAISVKGKRIRIPKLGWVKMHEAVRFTGQIKCATVSREADRWFVSLLIDTEIPPPARKNQGVVGVGLGVKDLATLSTGEKIGGPKPYRTQLQQLRRLDRQVWRRKRGGENRKKAAQRRACVQRRVANSRAEALHQLTTRLTQEFSTIVIEDLNVEGMKRNRHLSRAISDMGFGEFRRQLEYKAEQAGGQLLIAPRSFPSSKQCSTCGHVLKVLPLSTRLWTCPQCGVVHDRDHNASLNLKHLAGSSPATACGAESAGHVHAHVVKLSVMKQEPNASCPAGIKG